MHEVRWILVDSCEEVDSFAGRQTWVESRGGRIEAKVLANSLRTGNDVVSHDRGAAGRWCEDGRKHAERRRLAGPVRAEKPENFAFMAFKADRVDSFYFAAALIVKSLSQISHNH